MFGVVAAACSSGESGSSSSTSPSTSTATTSTAVPGTAATTTTAMVVTATGAPITELVTSKRVNLDFVSAYIIDTGVRGSATAIAAAVAEYGNSWVDVGYVIATHEHGDHVGSLNEVIAQAGEADVFAGDLDVAEIASDRSITALFDRDMGNGVAVVTTPGHTRGHISLLDPDIGLFSGDAINGANGGVIGPNPRYTSDMDTALASVKKLATFSYEPVFFGRGEAVLVGGSAAVGTLADSL